MEKEIFICHICGLQLGHKRGLISHIQGVHLGIRFPCEVCNKTFKRKSFAEKHKLIHTGQEPYSCQYCPKKFVFFTEFKLHVINHSDLKRFNCSVCNKQFAHKSYLTRHFNEMHNPSFKQYVCSECGASFKSSNHLKRHTNIHLNRKPYVCQFCGKQCTQSSNLKIHIMGVHKDLSHLVYNQQHPKLDPSTVVIPSYKDYKKTLPDKVKATKKQPKKETVKKNKERKNTGKKTKVHTKINGEDNSLITNETTSMAACSGSDYDSISATNNNEERNTHYGYVTFSKIQHLKMPCEWNEVRQCKVDLHDCKFKIPIKEETETTPWDDKSNLKIPIKEEADAPSWGDTDNLKISIKKESPSWDYTKNLKTPVQEYEVAVVWDNADDKESFENKITESTHEDVKPTSPLPSPKPKNKKQHETSNRTKPLSSAQCNEENKTTALNQESDDNLVSCKHCNKKYTKRGLTPHLRNTHHACRRCDRLFLNADELKKHFSTYCCKYCDKSFKSPYVSDKHKAEHELTPQIFTCDLCGKNYMSRTDLSGHMSSAHSTKKFLCQECPKVFSLMRRLKKHMLRMHSQDRPYECQYCPKKYAVFDDWKNHLLISHTNKKSRMCHICSKHYVSSGSLSNHIKHVHMNIRKYKCEICGASFAKSNKLKSHSYIHSNIKPFKCQFCGKECTQASNLKIHIMGVHRDVSHLVYKKVEAFKQVDPNSIVIPTDAKQYFETFPPNTNTNIANKNDHSEIPEESKS